MATGTTITVKENRGFFPTEILPFLEEAKKTYRIDAKGMADGGECLTSSFLDYCDLGKMQLEMNNSGQQYKVDAITYAKRYNQLFEIDC